METEGGREEGREGGNVGVREGGRGEDVGAGGDLAFDSGVVDGDWGEGGREEGREGGRDVRE